MFDREQIKQEYNSLLTELADPEVVSDREHFSHLLAQKARLETILEKLAGLDEVKKQKAENEAIISAAEDQDLTVLAHEEIKSLGEREKSLLAEMEILSVMPAIKPSQVSSAAIIEIRAGVGGDEAALWARNLFDIYVGFAKFQNWQINVLDSSDTSIGGLKEVVFEIKPGTSAGPDRDVFSKMFYEAGVHRVQRIPDTEKSGRVHTSTATVAVLKKPKETSAVKINPNEVQIEFSNASGPGGQNVNKRKTAVRVLHIPTGIVVTCRTERSQLQNKESALAILVAKLEENSSSVSKEEVLSERRQQIGQAKRAEKIRTYNFPQDRLTDHRIKKSWKNLQEIIKGKLSHVIEELEKQLAKNK